MSIYTTHRTRRHGNRTDGRLVRAVFGFVFSVAAAFVISILVANTRAARAVRDGWIATPCTVVSSEVREGPNGTWLFSARYTYVFDGCERESSDVRPGSAELSFDEVARRARLLADFPAGGMATCLVNPAAPSEAALFPPDTEGVNVAFVFAAVFLVVGLAMLFVPSRRRDESKDEAPEKPEPSSRIPLLVGIAFTTVGAIFAGFAFSFVVRTIEARSWTPVEATVLRSEVVRGTSHSNHGTRTTFLPYVAYSYEVGGERFEGDRYGATKISTGDPGPARLAVQEHPAGSRATVWVDPDDPSRSVFSDPHGPIPVAQCVFVVFPLVFLGIGLAVLFSTLRDRRLAGAPLPPGPPVLRDDRRSQFFRGILFAAFWNGFVAMVFFAMRTASGGRVDPVFAVFLGVFGLVGIFLLGTALRAGAKIFAPRLELTCGRGFLPRGGEALVAYRLLGGGPGDVVGAKIELIAQRFETVRQGKNTYQRPVDLSREMVFKTDSFRALARGDFRVAIPAAAPASSRGPEPVRWHFAVELARPARKSLRDEYPVVVR
ncbi:MAG: DUF3592 domain-containing protein [Kiritimatiellae bacterium]|nr:DUF3592 domain-containing protein [Kiritimatiellia bacterium]